MAFLGFGVGVVNPAAHGVSFICLDLHTPERECFRGMEFGPLHLLKLVIWIGK